jgi:uncharacterized protein
VTEQDTRRDYGENRFITAGWLQGRMVVVVWTLRSRVSSNGQITPLRHIISMRYCHEKEEKRWRRRMG